MSGLFDHFKAYLINLPERRDRLASATKELARAGWRIGDDGVELYPAQRVANRAGFQSSGIRGCFLSHVACLSSAARAGRHALVLEDDIALTASFPGLMQQVLEFVTSSDWDFVYFGHEETGTIPTAHSDAKAVHFRPWTTDILTAHFYGVHSRALPGLLSHLSRAASGIEGDHEFGPMPLDGALNVFRRLNSDVRTFISDPKLGWQRPSRSDLMPRAFDSLHSLRPLVTILRELKYKGSRWRL
jgi:glycosyl transferase family 25